MRLETAILSIDKTEKENPMKLRASYGLVVLVCVYSALFCSGAWALDEGILTPTNDTIVTAEEQDFAAAMNVWNQHRYADGEKLMRSFAKNHPNSRWRAEAELHCGCYLTFKKDYRRARPIFERLVSEYADSNIRNKAKLRLGNIAERQGQYDEAIGHYKDVFPYSRETLFPKQARRTSGEGCLEVMENYTSGY
jgi:TolA-binding protein